MGVVVAFSYSQWIAEFPEFTAIQAPQATGFFNRATILHANDGSGPVSTAAIQSALLNLVTAHIAALNAQSQGDQTPGAPKDANTPVGRIASAAEGSVNASFDYGAPGTSTQSYFTQSKYGAEYWTATRVYRTMRYAPNPFPFIANPLPWGGGYNGGGQF